MVVLGIKTLGPPEEQEVLLTTDPSFQPLKCNFLKKTINCIWNHPFFNS